MGFSVLLLLDNNLRVNICYVTQKELHNHAFNYQHAFFRHNSYDFRFGIINLKFVFKTCNSLNLYIVLKMMDGNARRRNEKYMVRKTRFTI